MPNAPTLLPLSILLWGLALGTAMAQTDPDPVAPSPTATGPTATSPTATAAEVQSTQADQEAVAVTIYNNDLALVKDQRTLHLPAGTFALAMRDVSARIQPETALLRVLDGAPPLVLEQNFDFDLLTPTSLLEKYVGREVGLITRHPGTGAETEQRAEVLAASDGLVLRIGERIEAGRLEDLPGRLVYPDIPANLRDRPTLLLSLQTAAAGSRTLELSYLTGGLRWQADYVGELAPNADRLDLTGWVTLENRSGTSYRQARLQLVAGAVHRVADAVPMSAAGMPMRMAAAPQMETEPLFEYHLYRLPTATSIADNQTKQVALLAAPGVLVAKELLLQGNANVYRQGQDQGQAQRGPGRPVPVQVRLRLRNDVASNLGLPLPAGVVRIYQRDGSGEAQFIGEDRIDHTPRNETAHLRLGTAFDVTAERRQLAFTKLSGSGPWNYQYESAFEITIRNAKAEPVTVRVQEPIPGDWTMLQESAPHERASADTAVWHLEVPAGGATVLAYRVRVRL